MGVVGRLDQYASMLATEFDETTANNPSITGLGTYYASEFSENVGIGTTLTANVFPPYDPVYDEFGGTLFGAGQGRYKRQNTDKSVIVYSEIDEISDFRDIVRSGLVLDLDAGMNSSFNNTGTTWNDLSGSSSNGTLVNGPTYSSANGGSIVFDGVNDYVSSVSNLTLGGSFSISLWVKHNNSSPAQERYISLGSDRIVIQENENADLNLYVTDGTQQNLWNWGFNSFGELGDNNTTTRSTPVTTFLGGNNWKSVAGGYFHTAAIKTDGTLWTWSYNNLGQLGTNNTTDRSTPVTTFAGGTNWKQIDCGGYYTAAIKTDGTLWVWGRNNLGQLGTNNTTNRSTPVTTFTGGSNWKSVAGGDRHTAAIKTDGSLWTWGAGGNGQIGDNNTTNRSTPVTTFLGGNDWKSVAGGIRHTVAIKTDGTLWTWGLNDNGQLGINDTTQRNTPVTTFAGGTNWKSVTGGRNHTVAIKTDGTLWTWGFNSYGQLGNNASGNRSTPVTTFPGGTNWKQVSGGGFHTAAIKTDGTFINDISTNASISNTTYYNIVATSNGTTLKLYQNNSLVTTATLNGTLSSTSLSYTISSALEAFGGNLASVQVYNKELSATEIQQNYNALKHRYEL